MRLYWKIGEHNPDDPGLMQLASERKDEALLEADAIWYAMKDGLGPPPHGYLVYERDTGRLIHEYTVDRDSPTTKGDPQKGTTLVDRLLAWWRLRRR